MGDETLREWAPGRKLPLVFATVWLLWGLWQFSTADDLVRILLTCAFFVFLVAFVSSSQSYRVRSDAEGLHVRDAWWRTRTVAWTDVSDICPRGRGAWPLLVVETSDGQRLKTGLTAADNASLPLHWRIVTGRATLEDYAALDLEDYAGSR